MSQRILWTPRRWDPERLVKCDLLSGASYRVLTELVVISNFPHALCVVAYLIHHLHLNLFLVFGFYWPEIRVRVTKRIVFCLNPAELFLSYLSQSMFQRIFGIQVTHNPVIRSMLLNRIGIGYPNVAKKWKSLIRQSVNNRVNHEHLQSKDGCDVYIPVDPRKYENSPI